MGLSSCLCCNDYFVWSFLFIWENCASSFHLLARSYFLCLRALLSIIPFKITREEVCLCYGLVEHHYHVIPELRSESTDATIPAQISVLQLKRN
jgi:hypothetical protein